MGLKFILVVVRHLLGSLSVFGPMAGTLGPIANPNTPNKGFNPPPAAHPTTHPNVVP